MEYGLSFSPYVDRYEFTGYPLTEPPRPFTIAPLWTLRGLSMPVGPLWTLCGHLMDTKYKVLLAICEPFITSDYGGKEYVKISHKILTMLTANCPKEYVSSKDYTNCDLL